MEKNIYITKVLRLTDFHSMYFHAYGFLGQDTGDQESE
jgi:hypothetical protein